MAAIEEDHQVMLIRASNNTMPSIPNGAQTTRKVNVNEYPSTAYMPRKFFPENFSLVSNANICKDSPQRKGYRKSRVLSRKNQCWN